MAGEQKRKERAALITKALLLGYQIKPVRLDEGPPYLLITPQGKIMAVSIPGGVYPTMWRAAHAALIHAGVTDATEPRRDLGIGSSKAFRLRGGSRKRGRFPGKP